VPREMRPERGNLRLARAASQSRVGGWEGISCIVLLARGSRAWRMCAKPKFIPSAAKAAPMSRRLWHG
jgi:hypothetical protein